MGVQGMFQRELVLSVSDLNDFNDAEQSVMDAAKVVMSRMHSSRIEVMTARKECMARMEEVHTCERELEKRQLEMNEQWRLLDIERKKVQQAGRQLEMRSESLRETIKLKKSELDALKRIIYEAKQLRSALKKEDRTDKSITQQYEIIRTLRAKTEERLQKKAAKLRKMKQSTMSDANQDYDANLQREPQERKNVEKARHAKHKRPREPAIDIYPGGDVEE